MKDFKDLTAELRSAVEDLRIATGLTASQFVFHFGVSNAAFSQWKNGICQPSSRSVHKMLDAFSKDFPQETTALSEVMQELNELRKQHSSRGNYIATNYKRHFDGRKPYCIMHVGVNEVGIYDFGVTHEGFGIVLAAYIDPPDNRTWFRKTAVLKDTDGYYIQKGGYRFYFADADHATKEFNEFVSRITEV